MTKKVTGTKEWSQKSKNLFIGCKHNCRYCYGRSQPPFRVRKKRHPEISQDTMTPTKEITNKPKLYKNKDGSIQQIMYPTIHDIFPEHLDDTVKYLDGLLQVGNNIVIVSKPHLECIKRLCKDLSNYKEQITFRFTIGCMDNKILKFWEKDAPSYEERKQSLIHAFNYILALGLFRTRARIKI